MASFDIINAVLNAYTLLWRYRIYLLSLAAIPFGIILLNHLLVSSVSNPLRQGALLLPALLAEGWLISQWLRTLATGEMWPRPYPLQPNNISPEAHRRVRAILSALLAYVLAKWVISALLGVLAKLYLDGTLKKLAEAGDPLYLIGNLALIVALIYGFKPMWSYIPLAAGAPYTRYRAKTQGWMPGIHMAGLWLCATLPIMGIVMLITPLLFPLLGTPDKTLNFIGLLFLHLIEAGSQLALTLVGSTAMALALLPLLRR